jgi:hypothetical protein
VRSWLLSWRCSDSHPEEDWHCSTGSVFASGRHKQTVYTVRITGTFAHDNHQHGASVVITPLLKVTAVIPTGVSSGSGRRNMVGACLC